jgi:hypothetical protein
MCSWEPESAVAAAIWTASKIPESTFVLSFHRPSIMAALPTAAPTRQPVMLYALLSENISMPTAAAPSLARKLGAT